MRIGGFIFLWTLLWILFRCLNELRVCVQKERFDTARKTGSTCKQEVFSFDDALTDDVYFTGRDEGGDGVWCSGRLCVVF